MKKPLLHPHAEVIKAWADGAQTQYYALGEWHDMVDEPVWYRDQQYRIKPETKPDMVFYGQLDEPARGGYTLGSCFTREYNAGDKLKIVFDGSTGKLKSAEVL